MTQHLILTRRTAAHRFNLLMMFKAATADQPALTVIKAQDIRTIRLAGTVEHVKSKKRQRDAITYGTSGSVVLHDEKTGGHDFSYRPVDLL